MALRTLGRARGFTAAALATLALGMGANTLVYAVVDALILRPLPFANRSSRLVTLHSTHPTRAQDWDDSLLSYADLVDVREQSRTLEDLQGVLSRNFSLSSTGDTEHVIGASVTPGLFAMLGVTPQQGRLFTDADGAAPGFESVVAISDALWRRLYGADPSIVGRGVLVNGRQLTVVAVMPPRFGFPENDDVWLPLRQPRDRDRAVRWILPVGLLRRDAALDEARAEMQAIAAQLASKFPATNRSWGIFVMPMRDLFVDATTRRAVSTLLGAVALVLLVACANVASLLIARGVGRQRELILRAALGARRWRLVRMLVIESFVLAVAGAAAGLLLASWGLDAFIASNPEPPPYWARLEIDARVMVYAFLVAVFSSILFGLVPALKVTRSDSAGGALRAGRSAGATPSQRRFQGGLIVAQVAVSLALLVGATLLARSAIELQRADTGFESAPLLSLRFYIAGDAYDEPAARARALGRVVDEVSRVPGVEAVAATGSIPADDGGIGLEVLSDRGMNIDEAIGVEAVPITPSLFATLGLPALDGRTFDQRETENPSADVVIINRRLARRLWGAQPAVGRTLQVVQGDRLAPLRVVGVAPDVLYEELGEETTQSQFTVYVPYARLGWRTMALLVRTGGKPSSLTAEVRQAVRRVDIAFASYDVMTMDDRRVFTQWGERFIGRTFAAFALAALLLACVGVYGLTAYSAAQRTKEIGLRIAVGATRKDVVGLLMGRGVRLAGLGLLLGFPLAVFAARSLQGLLFNVRASDARTWAVVLVALLAPLLAANLLPAGRASRCDPADALREE